MHANQNVDGPAVRGQTTTTGLGGTATFLPLAVIAVFYCGTYLLYQSNLLIEFPERNEALLNVYLLVTFSGICAGYLVGFCSGGGQRKPSSPPLKLEKAATLGVAISAALFFPTIKLYTGQQLSALFSLLTDPSSAYIAMVSTVTGTRAERLWFVLLKAAVSPLVMLAIPLFAYTYFGQRRHGKKLGFVIVLMLVMSVFRGTDKEIFDAFILTFGGAIVGVVKGWSQERRSRPERRWIITFVLALIVAISVFSFRKQERLGEAPYYCFKGTEICHPLMVDSRFGPASVGVMMFARYMTQGYYGLSVALEADHESGHGVGHSRPLGYLASELFGWNSSDIVVSQLDDLGWASRGVWSTGVVWLANDVPFEYVPLVLFLLAAFLARLWRDSIQSGDHLSVVLFAYLFFTFIYMPGNLQLAQSGDLYFGFLFWCLVYLVRMLGDGLYRDASSGGKVIP